MARGRWESDEVYSCDDAERKGRLFNVAEVGGGIVGVPGFGEIILSDASDDVGLVDVLGSFFATDRIWIIACNA